MRLRRAPRTFALALVACVVLALATMGGALQPAFIVSPKRMPYMNVYGRDSSDEVRRTFSALP